MSWLRALEIGLDITNVAVNISNAAQLNELQRMGASAELRMRIAKELRNQIFTFRQAADAALSAESISVFRTTVAMKLLEQRLKESQITPDDFDDFADKEYVYTVTRHIQENTQRLYYLCSTAEQQDIPRLVQAILRLPDYKYFLAKNTNYIEYKRAKTIVDIFGERNSSGTGFGLGWVKVGMALGLGLYAITSGSVFIGVLMVGLWIGGYVFLNRWQNAEEYNVANSTCESLKRQIDVERMAVLTREFGSIDHAQKLCVEAEKNIRNAFGNDATMLLR